MEAFNFKCKYCGGEMNEVDGLKSVGKCKYCGSKQTLPKLHNEKRANLFERANHLRRNNEFDKAEALYEQILNEDLTDPEAYWSLVLCRYGIEYVEDKLTERRIPTVNRMQMTSILGDEDYKSAIANADDEQRQLYEEEAKAINEIQRGILEIAQKEAPFDIFICYKETDESGKRSRDSVLAQDLHHELTRDGYKVFFARVTLQGKLGSAYEPYIFSALNSSKVMVVLGTKPEHFEAVWVRNEWSRFLGQIKKGERKVLIPAYRDMDAYDLPVEFSNLQALDMSRLGFMQELVMAIENILSMYKKPSEPAYAPTPTPPPAPAPAPAAAAPTPTPAPKQKKEEKPPKKKKKAGCLIVSLIALLLVATMVTGLLAAMKLISLPFELPFELPQLPFFSGGKDTTESTAGVSETESDPPIVDPSDSKLKFTEMGGEYYVSGIGSETSATIYIPSTYNGLPVTSIGVRAFANCTGIEEVVIPDSVKSIGSSAFENCSLLSKITIPASVTKIGANAFKKCTALKTISYRGSSAQWNTVICETGWNSSLTDYVIKCTDTEISPDDQDKLKYSLAPGGQSYIVSGAETGIVNVTIPATYSGLPVTEIASSAFFQNQSLLTVTIPASITKIGDNAFQESGLTQVTFADGSQLQEIGNQAFREVDITSLELPQGVETIGEHCFSFCDKMTAVSFPSSISEIKTSAFAECNALEAVTLTSDAITLGNNAFFPCTGLKSVEITGELSSGDSDSFTLFDISATDYKIHASVIPYVIKSSVETLDITGGTSIPQGAFTGALKLQSVTISESITEIGEYAFDSCESITDFTFQGTADQWQEITSKTETWGTGFDTGNVQFGSSEPPVVNPPVVEPPEDSSSEVEPPIVEPPAVDPDESAVTSIDPALGYKAVMLQGNLGKKFYVISSMNGYYLATTDNSAQAPDIYFEAVDDGYYMYFLVDGKKVYLNITARTDSTYHNPALENSPSSVWNWNTEYSCLVSNYSGIDYFLGTNATTQYSDLSVNKLENHTNYFKMYLILSGTKNPNAGGSSDNTGEAIFPNSSIKYVITADRELILSGTGAIPSRSEMGTVPWDGKEVHFITVQDGITSIGADAFSGMTYLTTVRLADSVTDIGAGAFQKCTKLANVEMPGVKTIQDNAFYRCSTLHASGIHVEGVLDEISQSAFSETAMLQKDLTAENPAAIVGGWLLAISPNASGEYILPYDAEKIGKGAFHVISNLTNIVIHQNVTYIGAEAFFSSDISKMPSIRYLGSQEEWGRIEKDERWADGYDQSKISFATGTDTPDGTISGTLIATEDGVKIDYVLTPEAVLTLSGTGPLPSRSTIDALPWEAEGCVVRSIVLGEGITAVGENLFSELPELETVTFPSTLNTIEANAFSSCPKLSSVNLENTQTVSSHAFSGCTTLREVYAGSVITINAWAFSGCTALEYVEIPAVQEIYNGAFARCSSLTSVEIPNIKKISTVAFENCSSLETLIVGNNLNEFYSTALTGTPLLDNLTAENPACIVGNWLVKVVSSGWDVTEYTVPENVTHIAGNAFGEIAVNTIIIHTGVTHIMSDAFKDNLGATRELRYTGTEAEWALVTKSPGWDNGVSAVTCTDSTGGENGSPSDPECEANNGAHTFDGYLTNEESHWQNCTACGQTVNSAAHTFVDGTCSVCGYAQVVENDAIEVDGVLYTHDPEIGGYIITGYTDALISSWFYSNTEYTTQVVAIADGAFNGCTVLTSLHLDKMTSLTSIGKNAFANCTNLRTLTLPQTLTTIGEGAFSGCSSLRIVTVPANVTSIGINAFANCTSLSAVTFTGAPLTVSALYADGITTVISITNDDTAANAVLLNSTYVNSSWTLTPGASDDVPPEDSNAPASEVTVDNIKYTLNTDGTTYTLADGKSASGNVTIPAQVNGMNVTGIAVQAFYKNTAITSVTFESSNLTYVGYSAFSGCSSLTTIDMTNATGLTYLPHEMFFQCGKLTNVTLPDSITSLGVRVFATDYSDTLISSLSYHEENNACYLGSTSNPCIILMKAKDTSITSCTINANTKLVYNNAFANCNNLTYNVYGGMHYLGTADNQYFMLVKLTSKTASIYYIQETAKIIYNDVFNGCSYLTTITIPEGVVSIGDYAFFGCSQLKTITLPNTILHLGQEMFTNCTSLTSITLPENVKTIGHSFFYGCGSLTSVTFPSSLVNLGANIFVGCNVTSVTLPATLKDMCDGALSGVSNVTFEGTQAEWNAITKGSGWGNPATVTCTGVDNTTTTAQTPEIIESSSISFPQSYGSTSDNGSSVDLNGAVLQINDMVSATFAMNSGNNAPQYYYNGTAVRMYPNNTMTVDAADGYAITKIVITFVPNYDNSNGIVTVDTGTLSGGTWEGIANTVTFTVADGSTNRRITAIEVHYGSIPEA